MLEHAVLMDAALMREGVGADDRLVGLDDEAGDRRDEARGAGDVFASTAVVKGMASWRVRSAMTISSIEALPARSPRPLTVHSTWRAPARTAARELATARPRSLWQWTEITAWSILGTRSNSMRMRAGEFLGHGVADRVGDIDGARPGLDRALDRAAQEVVLGAGAVLARPFDIVAEIAGVGDAVDDRLMHLRGLHLELVFHVQRRGRDEGVDARPRGMPHRFGAAFDVAAAGAGEAAHRRRP